MGVRGWEIAEGPPHAGVHYPRDASQLYEWFRTEHAAREYLTSVRFQVGVSCPRCHGQVGAPKGDRWWCPPCRRWFTVTTGTLLERTKVPLRIWLEVAWHLIDTKVGVSATSVAQLTGLDYRSAWGLLHKLRRAMDQSGRERLHGEVEFDETYVGGMEEGARGRSRGKKQPVAVACERVSDTRMGRIRLARLPDASALAIADFFEHHVEPGSVLVSDKWAAYTPALDELAKRGLAYEHRPTSLRATGEQAHQAALWPDWRHFAFLTDLEGSAVELDAFHRHHAVVELAIDDLKEGAGRFTLPLGQLLCQRGVAVLRGAGAQPDALDGDARRAGGGRQDPRRRPHPAHPLLRRAWPPREPLRSAHPAHAREVALGAALH